MSHHEDHLALLSLQQEASLHSAKSAMTPVSNSCRRFTTYTPWPAGSKSRCAKALMSGGSLAFLCSHTTLLAAVKVRFCLSLVNLSFKNTVSRAAAGSAVQAEDCRLARSFILNNDELVYLSSRLRGSAPRLGSCPRQPRQSRSSQRDLRRDRLCQKIQLKETRTKL